MDKLQFSVDNFTKFFDDDNVEFSIAKVDFFSNRPNSHKINITEEMLRRDAPSILGKFLVAKMNEDGTDAEGHEIDEVIMGYAPQDQEIEFKRTLDGYLVASCEFVISKLYATAFYEMFKVNNHKSVSVEMIYYNSNKKDDGTTNIDGFTLTGVTVLGDAIRPACADANIEIVCFSENDANKFYHQQHEYVNNLKSFAVNRRKNMAESKSYKINKTELKDVDWGSVDKVELRNKVMEAKNRNSLVKFVYALVEDGWEDAPSEHLKYPIMAEFDGTFYYVREALSSALAYAKQHNEDEVISKIEKLYKKFNIGDSNEKEGKGNMSDFEKFAMNLGHIWCAIAEVVQKRSGWNYSIEGIYEEDGQKFVILCDCNDTYYRVNFNFDEENGFILSDEKVEVKKEYLETSNISKFAEPEGIEQYKQIKYEEKVLEENVDDNTKQEIDYQKMFEDKQKELEEWIVKYNEQCEIVMSQSQELIELRKFKADIEEEQKQNIVTSTLAKVKGRVDENTYIEFAESGKQCNIENVNIWKTNLYAKIGENMMNIGEFSNNDEFIKMEIPKNNKQQSESVWDRL